MQLQARFVEDVTIPDGCVVSPSASLRKAWKLENSGETAWPLGCRLVLQAENPLFGIQADKTDVGLPALQPGEQFVAEVDVLVPAAPGRYTTFWRVCDPSGTQFGHRFWIDIVVASTDAEIISAFGADASALSSVADESVAPAAEVDDTATDANDDDDASSVSSSSSDSDSDSSSDSASDSGSDSDDVEIVDVRVTESADASADQYADALAMLASMGFADAAKNRRHLTSADGNVTDAVVSLLTE